MVQAIFLISLPPCLFALLAAVSSAKSSSSILFTFPPVHRASNNLDFEMLLKIWLGKIGYFDLDMLVQQNWAESEQKQFAKWKNNREEAHTCMQTDWSFKN